MAIRYLKESKSQSERREDDAKVKAIVEDTLGDIEARGDAAIRELSEKFDKYSPASFKLSDDVFIITYLLLFISNLYQSSVSFLLIVKLSKLISESSLPKS